MKPTLASIVVGMLLAACATDSETKYRVEGQGLQQERQKAEESYASQVSQLSSPKYDEPPKVVTSRFPEYPRALRLAGIQGAVVVEFTIGVDGKVSRPSVVGTSAPELEGLALRTIVKWEFKPALKGGVPIAVKARQKFQFRVE